MSNLNELARTIKRGIYLLREHRHRFLADLVDHLPNDVKYLDTNETDENVKKIGKAIKHLNKAKVIVERMKDRGGATST